MLTSHLPVVDLRSEPEELTSKDYSNHPSRLTQLLFGEPLRLLDIHGDYYFVEALHQEHFTQEEGWHGYRGFVHASEVREINDDQAPTHVVSASWTKVCELNLSYGTYLTLDKEGKALLPDGRKAEVNRKELRPLHSPFCRDRLISDSLHFLGAPYLWGGKASHGKETISSVDCSGLIYLLYRAQGILIPRDAHPQAMKGRRITREELKPSDLIYLCRENNPGKHTHVLLYKDKKSFLESPKTGECVREADFATHYKEEGPFVEIKGREGRYFPSYITFTG